GAGGGTAGTGALRGAPGWGTAPGRAAAAAPAAAGLASAGLIINRSSSAISAPCTVRRSTIVRSTPNDARQGTASISPRDVCASALEIPPASLPGSALPPDAFISLN